MSLRARVALAGAVILAAGFTAWAIRSRLRTPQEPLALILDSDGSLDAHVLLGLRVEVKDHLEALGSWTFMAAPEPQLQTAVPRLELRARRIGSGLALKGRAVFAQGERAIDVRNDNPTAALHAALAPLLGPRGADPLDPGDAEAFWEVLPLLAAPLDRPEPEMREALAAAVALKARQGSASVALAEAHLRFRLLVANADIGAEAHGTCDNAFQDALRRMPDYPRLVYLYANYRTDVGDPKGALEIVFKALQSHPRLASLHNSAAYAARTSGLLEGALRAAKRREELRGGVDQTYFLAENTLLYSGQWEAFEASLLRGQGEDPVQAFYLGYVRILLGKPGAEEAFRKCLKNPAGLESFRTLCGIYLDALEGRKAQALERLHALDEERGRVRVPDGEFTFKLAEAYGFLGEDRAAFEVAQRALGQGFACTEWYERAPFLARLHGRPAWESLMAALRERQKRMEARFPADRFGK